MNYQYQGAIKHPYLLGGVSFKSVMLTYVSDTLISITLSNLYLSRFYPDYSKRAKREFRQLCTFLKEQWNAGDIAMKVALYEDKSKANRLYDISVTLELAGMNE